MSTDNLDLAELRQRTRHALVQAAKWGNPFGPARIDLDAAAVLALLDRIESLEAEPDAAMAEANRLRRLLGSHADGHRCTCTMLSAGDHINPPEWEQDEWCPTHPNMDAVTADFEAEKQRADRAEARLARVTDDSMAEGIEATIRKRLSWASMHWGLQDKDMHRNVAQAVLEDLRAVAADEQSSFAEAIAPITKQSKQWADATSADEQEAGR